MLVLKEPAKGQLEGEEDSAANASPLAGTAACPQDGDVRSGDTSSRRFGSWKATANYCRKRLPAMTQPPKSPHLAVYWF